MDVHTDAQITVSDLPQYRNITVSPQNTGQVGRRVTHGSVEGDWLRTELMARDIDVSVLLWKKLLAPTS
jgi:hypothetical protein